MAATGSARRPAKGARRFFNYPRRGKGPIHRWIPSWRVVVGAFLGFFALGAGVVVAAYASTSIPGNLDSINDQVTTIYYADGVTPITTIQNETRVKVSIADLPEHVGNAVVASEDSTFWTNSGINPRGLARALWTNLTTGARQGGSTLTQQYVERTMTDSETSYLGKVREMIIAVKVTRTQPKEEILERYLNTIYWGRNVNGVEAAAQSYFGKSAKDLTISEAAMLAGIIPSPNNWDPDRNLEQAQRRWTRVMNRMLDQGLITQAERDEAAFPAFNARPQASNSLGGQAGYIVKMVEDEIGDLDQFRNGRLRTRGLSIVTTIDQRLQDTAVQVAQEPFTGENPADDTRLAVGLVSMDPGTGELRAVYGGPDYVSRPFNFATQGTAQAGSTFKPITLLAAVEDGHQLNERFDGSNKQAFPGTTWTKDKPLTNFGGENPGEIDLIKATANSVNTAYAALNIEIGPQRTADVAHRLGIPESRTIEPVPSNVLGTASVSTVNLATAYSTLANGGYRVTPHVVREVKGLDGSLIYTGPTEQVREFALEDVAAVTYAMTHVIKDGSGRTAQELNRPVAGKTGTSQNNISSWFAGFVPQLVTVVGLHQEDPETKAEETVARFGEWINSRTGMTGSTFPARAWTDFMKVALDGVEIKEFPAFIPPRSLASPSPSPEDTPTDEPTMEAPPVDPQAGWVDVPKNLTGRDIAKVTQTLERLGLKVRPRPVEADQKKGTVLAVSGEGTTVPPNATITVDVSTGRVVSGGEEPTSTQTPSTEPPEPTETSSPEPTGTPSTEPPQTSSPEPTTSTEPADASDRVDPVKSGQDG